MTESLRRGVYPVYQTPFTEDEEVDLVALEQEIDWIARQGAEGVVLGMVSEVLRLSDRERKAVVAAASSAAHERGLVSVASVGAESTSSALQRVDDAVAAGADALMVTPPLLADNQPDQLAAYFRAVLERSAVPVVIQDASSYVGQPLSIALQADLFEQFGQKVAFKPEAVPITPTLEALLAATDGRAMVFEGMGGGALLDSHPAGIFGSMPGAEVCWAVVALWRALESGDLTRGRAITDPLLQMLAMQTDIDSFVVCEKHLLSLQGVLTSTVARTPLRFQLSEADKQRLADLLNELSKAVELTPSIS